MQAFVVGAVNGATKGTDSCNPDKSWYNAATDLNKMQVTLNELIVDIRKYYERPKNMSRRLARMALKSQLTDLSAN